MEFEVKINEVIKRYLTSKNTLLSIGMIKENEQKIISYNYSKQELKDSFKLFDIGSLAKVITSLCVLKAHTLNLIDINKKVNQYLDLPDGNYPTIKNLLSHKCGYNHLTPIKITFFGLLKHRYSRSNIYHNITCEDVKKELIKRRYQKVSNKYGYSDFAYAVLALVMQEVTKMPFADYLNEFIKKDLELDSTKVIEKDLQRENCYLNNKKINNWVWVKDNPYIASGGIASTMTDMMKFVSKIIESKESFIQLSLQIQDDQKEHNLSWFISKRNTSVWHVGGVGLFRSSIIINPKRKIAVIAIGNSIGIKNGNIHYLTKMIYTYIRRNKVFKK